MITTSQEYLQNLFILQDQNFPQLIASDIPEDEPKLIIDLNTRMISAPEFLSVEKDHNSETLYFMVDRYFDNVDLATMSCIVQYQNASKDTSSNGYIYAVPRYYLIAPEGQQKLIFPWVIEGPATAYSGIVTFSVRFYRISGEYHEDINQSTLQYEYLLNTLPAKSKVLEGMDVLETSENYTYNPNVFADIYQQIKEIKDIYTDTNVLYWIKLGD